MTGRREGIWPLATSRLGWVLRRGQRVFEQPIEPPAASAVAQRRVRRARDQRIDLATRHLDRSAGREDRRAGLLQRRQRLFQRGHGNIGFVGKCLDVGLAVDHFQHLHQVAGERLRFLIDLGDTLGGLGEDSFQIQKEKALLIPTKSVYGTNDAFYEAKGHYSLFYTCNSWANQALKAAHQKAALWTISDTGILQHYNN